MKKKPGELHTPANSIFLQNGWIDYDTFCEAFGACKRTIARRRKNGLPHSKIGGKIYFQIEKVKAWMEAHEIIEKLG